MNLNISFTVVSVDGDFVGVAIALDNPEEDREVKLESSSIYVLGDIVTNNREVKTG